MGAAINGSKVAGFAVNGKTVGGLARNGVVIWRKPDSELIVNGGFENGLTGWAVVQSGQVVSSGDALTAYEGEKWFKATSNKGGVKQAVTVVPGATYHIQYAYGSAAAGRQSFIYLMNSSGTILHQKWTTGTVVGWTLVELDYTVPANVTSLVLQIGENYWGRFDAVSMRMK